MDQQPTEDQPTPGWRQLPSCTTKPTAPASPKPAPTLPRDLLVPIAHALLDLEAQKTTLGLSLLHKASFISLIPILYDCVKLASHQSLFTFLRSRLNGVLAYTEAKKREPQQLSKNEANSPKTLEESTQGPGDARFRFNLYTSSTKHLELIVRNINSPKKAQNVQKMEARALKGLKKRAFLNLETIKITSFHPFTSYRVENEITKGLIHTTILLFQAKHLRWRHIPPPADPHDPTEGVRIPPKPFTPGPRDKVMASLGKWDWENYLESWETPQSPFSLPLKKYRGLINTEHLRRFSDGFIYGWWASELESLIQRAKMGPEDLDIMLDDLSEMGEKDLLGIEGPGPAWLFYNASDASKEMPMKALWDQEGDMRDHDMEDMDSNDDGSASGRLNRASMTEHFHWIDDLTIGSGTGAEWREWVKRGIWSEKDAKAWAVGQVVGQTAEGAEEVD